MNRMIARYLSIILLCVCLGWVSVSSQGFRSVGLRVALSWSETPIWLGIEASTELAQSNLSAALFITPDGKTLFTSHLDIAVEEDASAFVRITGGFYYFGPDQPFPYPLAGIGLAYLPISQSPVYVGFAGEFIYPLAFPLPMFSISGGWLP
ncbi:hypothetical protein ACFLRV_00435 [Candidatus Bipolaricaulota bacterium]